MSTTHTQTLPHVQAFIEALPPQIGVYIFDLDGTAILANAVAQELWRNTPASVIDTSFNTLTNPESIKRGMADLFRCALRGESVEPHILTHQKSNRAGDIVGEIIVEVTQSLIRADDGTMTHICRVYRDITLEVRQKQELQQQAKELLDAEQHQRWLQHTIRELSTPVLPIYDGVLVAPLIGSIDTERARNMMETLLTSIQRHRAKIVLLDITGVPLVDTAVAAHLLQATTAIKLLGARVIMVGMRPEVAETVVQLGVDLGDMLAKPDLQAGLVAALSQLRLHIEPRASRAIGPKVNAETQRRRAAEDQSFEC